MKPLVPMLLALLALSGCTDPTSPPMPVAEETPAPIPLQEEVSFELVSGLWVCGAGACAGRNGPEAHSIEGRHIIAFDVEVRATGDEAAADALADVRIVVECAGTTCATREVASVTGPWPQRLQGSSLSIPPDGALTFHVEYAGPLPRPVNGSGASYAVEGTITVLQAA